MTSFFMAVSIFVASLFGAHPAVIAVPSAAAVATINNNQFAASPGPVAVQTVSPAPAAQSGASSAFTVTQTPAATQGVVLGTSTQASFVTQDELTAQINDLRSLITQLTATNTTAHIPEYIAASGNPANPYAANSAIDQINGATLSNVTFNGVSGLSAADIPDLSGSYLSLSGGSLSGALGIGTTSPAYTLDVNGFINTNQNSGYKQGGVTILTESSSNFSLAVGPGVNALNAFFNTGVGVNALASNVSGGTNVAVGYDAMDSLISGGSNVAVGDNALFADISSTQNVAIGRDALATTTGVGSTAVGYRALFNDTGGGNIAIGASAGLGVSGSTTSSDNVFIGNASGSGHTNGSNNTFVGFQSGNNLTTGSNNIILGANVGIASTTLGQQLDIGNVLYGSGLYNGGSVSSAVVAAGKIGIGTANPYSRLQITGPDSASSTSAFAVVTNASSTVFAVFDGGNAQLTGTLTQSSDQRLKTNITSLDASSTLALLEELNPVTFNWIDPNQATGPQLGLIAQQVQAIFPQLVSTTSPTALTPDGTLGVNYIGLISPIIKSIQALGSEVATIENTITGFAAIFHTNELCVGSTCVTPQQFQAMVAASGQSEVGSDTDVSDASATSPVISITGNNPAIINVGDTYSDLGATIIGPAADLNLGIQTFVGTTPIDEAVIDTSTPATYHIYYMVTDAQGDTSTSTRTVIVQAPEEQTASSTEATTTNP